MTGAIDLDGLEDWPLAPDDAERLVALSAEAGWNQTADDWRLMLELGEGYGLRAPDGTPVASALILPYGDQFAWVSMVLVTESYRRRGLATRLLDRCLDRLAALDLVPLLDATEAGRATYVHRGFRDLWTFQRWRATGPFDLQAPRHVRALQSADWPSVAAYDSSAFGADRTPILKNLHDRCRQSALVAGAEGRVTGCALARDGRIATHIGPLAADDQTTAAALLTAALLTVDGPVFVDSVDHHAAFTDRLAKFGFTAQRRFIRMVRGDIKNDAGDKTYAVAGPEFG